MQCVAFVFPPLDRDQADAARVAGGAAANTRIDAAIAVASIVISSFVVSIVDASTITAIVDVSVVTVSARREQATSLLGMCYGLCGVLEARE